MKTAAEILPPNVDANRVSVAALEAIDSVQAQLDADREALEERERHERAVAEAARRAQTSIDSRTVDVVCRKEGAGPELTLIEVVNLQGRSVRVGTWHKRADGYDCLRLVLAEVVE